MASSPSLMRAMTASKMVCLEPHPDDDPGGIVGQVVVPLQFVTDGLFQFDNAGGRPGISGAAFLYGPHRGLFDVVGRVEVGLARTQGDDVDALPLHGIGPGCGGDGDRLLDGEHPAGKFHTFLRITEQLPHAGFAI